MLTTNISEGKSEHQEYRHTQKKTKKILKIIVDHHIGANISSSITRDKPKGNVNYDILFAMLSKC